MDVFLPDDADYVVEVMDSSGTTVSRTEVEEVRRGWQTLTFIPQSLDGESFLETGQYTLGLGALDESSGRFEVPWAIVEDEE